MNVGLISPLSKDQESMLKGEEANSHQHQHENKLCGQTRENEEPTHRESKEMVQLKPICANSREEGQWFNKKEIEFMKRCWNHSPHRDAHIMYDSDSVMMVNTITGSDSPDRDEDMSPRKELKALDPPPPSYSESERIYAELRRKQQEDEDETPFQTLPPPPMVNLGNLASSVEDIQARMSHLQLGIQHAGGIAHPQQHVQANQEALQTHVQDLHMGLAQAGAVAQQLHQVQDQQMDLEAKVQGVHQGVMHAVGELQHGMGTVVTEVGQEIIRFKGTTEERLTYLQDNFWKMRGEINSWADWDIQEQVDDLRNEHQQAQEYSAQQLAGHDIALAEQRAQNAKFTGQIQELQQNDSNRSRDYRLAEQTWAQTQRRVEQLEAQMTILLSGTTQNVGASPGEHQCQGANALAAVANVQGQLTQHMADYTHHRDMWNMRGCTRCSQLENTLTLHSQDTRQWHTQTQELMGNEIKQIKTKLRQEFALQLVQLQQPQILQQNPQPVKLGEQGHLHVDKPESLHSHDSLLQKLAESQLRETQKKAITPELAAAMMQQNVQGGKWFTKPPSPSQCDVQVQMLGGASAVHTNVGVTPGLIHPLVSTIMTDRPKLTAKRQGGWRAFDQKWEERLEMIISCNRGGPPPDPMLLADLKECLDEEDRLMYEHEREKNKYLSYTEFYELLRKKYDKVKFPEIGGLGKPSHYPPEN